MAEKTLFQRIMDGELPGDIVYEDEQCIVLRDINPQAPVHLLIIPRKPIPSLNEITEEDATLVGHLFVVARQMAEREGIARTGYRTVFNTGPDAQQSVYHLHLHLLGGRKFTWPPG
ncbi:histidine triad nucleotide-binding protein [Rhodothermus profundi]|uniref:Histidine triad (HIT) family protein n=1 Tax=Rhodothermus profundi TaxID=633813 RepID=A0A1M6TVF7_9BACT|nr:histidine triad nucleotide-binding protein [Rhodothermus profundi]SHK60870.1 histidine triad (HIT) family protein [Rhodothermus profundi]